MVITATIPSAITSIPLPSELLISSTPVFGTPTSSSMLFPKLAVAADDIAPSTSTARTSAT